MRLALLSDIHGNLPALKAVLADIAKRSVDHIANLGDSLSGPLWPAETAALLMQQPWSQLAGNHERQLLTQEPARMGESDRYAHGQLGTEAMAWLASLPASLPLALDDALLCHGTPDSDLVYFMESVTPSGVRLADAEEIAMRQGTARHGLIACGHTHVPRAMRAANGSLLVNPGSVGLQAYDDDHPYLHFIENGSPDARYAIVEKTLSGWRAALITLPYDAEAAAVQAERNQRPDWAYALRTGYALRPGRSA
ncbi:metallophosphoesterase family protein [Chitinimonas naiadis]